MKRLVTTALQKILGLPRYVRWRAYAVYVIKERNRPDHGYSRAFYEHSEEVKSERYLRFAESVVATCAPSSVVDVGCGAGGVALGFKHAGVGSVKGFDYSADAVAMAREKGVDAAPLDLTAAEAIPATAEVCICLEVAEHLPSTFAEPLCHMLVAAAPVVIWSAAAPGQGGHLHFNEQPRSYWINLMKQQGMIYDQATERAIRDGYRGMFMGDYDENLMVFRRA